MELEEELRLSFYKEIASVNERHGVMLVQHTDTGKVFVKKSLNHYDLDVYKALKEGRYDGIPVIKDLIETGDSLTVIEDYISGHSLDEIIAPGPLSSRETIRIISGLCDILAPIHAHVPQIIHRDIKDSNVILDNEGRVYLIDFDASKSVTRGKNRDTDLIGTEEYAAPEQYGFGQSDQRTDIYALGVLANKLLTGKFPSEELYDGDLSQVIVRATSIDPCNRYQDVISLKKALFAASGGFEGNADSNDSPPSINSNTKLKALLSKLPYPIRELPGFRSGRILPFCAAFVWYALLIYLGFFEKSNVPDFTAAQNRFYDVATFMLLLAPSLYLGNYLGVRDKLPWAKTESKSVNFVRIVIGTLLSVIIIFLAVVFFSVVLQIQ